MYNNNFYISALYYIGKTALEEESDLLLQHNICSLKEIYEYRSSMILHESIFYSDNRIDELLQALPAVIGTAARVGATVGSNVARAGAKVAANGLKSASSAVKHAVKVGQKIVNKASEIKNSFSSTLKGLDKLAGKVKGAGKAAIDKIISFSFNKIVKDIKPFFSDAKKLVSDSGFKVFLDKISFITSDEELEDISSEENIPYFLTLKEMLKKKIFDLFKEKGLMFNSDLEQETNLNSIAGLFEKKYTTDIFSDEESKFIISIVAMLKKANLCIKDLEKQNNLKDEDDKDKEEEIANNLGGPALNSITSYNNSMGS